VQVDLTSSKEDKDTVTKRDEAEIRVETESDHLKYFCFEMDRSSCPICVDLLKCHLCPSHTKVAVKDSNTSKFSHLKSKHPEEYVLACQASKKRSKSFRTEEAAAPKLTLG